MTWAQQAKLTAEDRPPREFAPFGSSVAISGDTVVIGAPGDNLWSSEPDGTIGRYSGSAYVFHRNGATWAQQAKLTASDAARAHWFGSAVDISGDTALLGAFGGDSVYAFQRSGTDWTELAKLSVGEVPDRVLTLHGIVAISAATGVVGVPKDDSSRRAGLVYVLRIGT